MSAPTPLSTGVAVIRCQSAFDLEVTLVKFLTKLFDGARLDNPGVNTVQPDEVPYDPTERAQSLTLKVPPKVVRGRVPRTVTGEIALDSLPDIPAIIVQVVSAKVQRDVTHAMAKIWVSAYDENPDGQGYQDVLNMIESATTALTGFGQAGLDAAYVIVPKDNGELLSWMLVEEDTFPHFIGCIECQWQLASARPQVNDWSGQAFAIPIPGEDIELRASAA